MSSGSCSCRHSPRWWGSGPRSRSTFPTCRGTRAVSGRRSWGSSWDFHDDDAVRLHRGGGDSASDVIFGEPIWDPVQLLSRIENPVVVLIALFALLIATLTTNVAANVVAPANGFANLWPSRISFAVGGVITGVIGIAIMPWQLLENADRSWDGSCLLGVPRPDRRRVHRGLLDRAKARLGLATSTRTTASTAHGTRGRSPRWSLAPASPHRSLRAVVALALRLRLVRRLWRRLCPLCAADARTAIIDVDDILHADVTFHFAEGTGVMGHSAPGYSFRLQASRLQACRHLSPSAVGRLDSALPPCA